MSVVVVGLHERDVPLDLLADAAISEQDLPKALHELCDSSNLAEAVVVSTCLRTEVYAVAERFHDGVADIQSFFESRIGADADGCSLAERLFVAFDDSAARHLFEVAAGLDSAVLGEGEILRQVRSAAELARAERAAGPVLERLFRHAVEVGKRARSETAIARGITSLSHVAVALAAERFEGGLASRRVAVIGAGEMGTGITEALSEVEGVEIDVVNRRLERAVDLAARFGARPMSLAELPQELAEADVVISAITNSEPLVTRAVLKKARPEGASDLLVIDASMPRSVELSVAELPGVDVLDMDDLRRFAESQMEARRAEIDRVDQIVEDELERYRVHVRSREVAPLVSALRARGESLIAEELYRVQSKLDRLAAEDAALVADVARRVVAKLLHEPTVELKQAAGSARGERLSEALRTLFDL